ncbi:sesquiterpene synthase 2-like [Fagus crenata]
MSIQVSGALSQNAKPKVIRRTANFHPSIWGDLFINNNSEDKVIHVGEVEELKEEVRRDLLASAGHPSQ